MIAGGLLAVLAVTGFAWGASLRVPIGPTLLAAYVAVVAETTLLTAALSPVHLVTRAGLAGGELVVLVAALLVWQRRGRPIPAVGHVPGLLRTALRDPATALLFAAVVAAVVYELVLGLTVPPNNWDSLTYHLPRVAEWARHGSIYWIPNAPTDRINEFQTLAEQELLFLFVVTGKGALYALPQFVAELAIVASIYVAARRIGFDVRQGMCAALFFASLPLVALEATTAQNDLVAASLTVAAAALLLGAAQIDLVLAGVATSLGLGVKLTTALVLPVLALLAYARGRRALGVFALAGAVSFVALGMWSFVLNLVNTGHVLGHGGGRVEQQASPSLTGSPATAFRILFRLLDLTGLSGRLLFLFAGLGVGAAVVTFVVLRRRGSSARTAAVAMAAIALPLLAPRVVPDAAHALHLAADAVSLPVNAPATTGGKFFWGITYGANEDLSGFGPLAGPALLVVSLVALIGAGRRRVGLRIGALGVALPLFVVLLALSSKYNPWLVRFMLIPLALGAPLLAVLFRRREVAFAIAVVTVAGLVGVQLHNELKPLHGRFGFAWQLTQAQAASLTFQPGAGEAVTALNQDLPASSCVGAVVGSDDPGYLLFGPKLGHKVVFLPRADAVLAARRDALPAVVIGHTPGLAASFAAAGWQLHGLPAAPAKAYWTLAVWPARQGNQC